jgi:hypothetical protein
VRPGNTYAYADTYCDTNCNAYTDYNSYSYSDSNCNAHSKHTTDAVTNTYGNSIAHGYPEGYAKASADSAPAANTVAR